ncbi:probable peroxygenase 4 [Primulina eburnea]|uniref:probable peroxygenase 4 n=1 Tax=Primulina eburnea TaxID=1245227 RepID=UPI003C6BEEC5
MVVDLDSFSSSSVDQQGMESDNLTVLQKHIMFFDRDNDGIIYPWETFQGFRAIGCGIFLSSMASLLINISLSRKTRPGKPFSFKFPIEVKNIHLAKHGSDSGVYDKRGRFVSSKFEEIFSKHALAQPDSLTSKELETFVKSNKEPKDYRGWMAGYVEWKILYMLCKDKNGMLHKDVIRNAFDGSLFERMAKERSIKETK